MDVSRILALIYGYKKFNFNVVKEKRSKRKQVEKLVGKSTSVVSDIEIPEATQQYGLLSKWNQLKQFSWFYFISICKQASFWGIVLLWDDYHSH